MTDTAIIPEVGKKYMVKIDANNVWAAIMSESNRDNPFEYLSSGLWRSKSGTNYNFDCEIINEIV